MYNEKLKILEENTGENLCDPVFGDNILDTTPKPKFTKEKKDDKLDFIKIKMFHAVKNTDRLIEAVGF